LDYINDWAADPAQALDEAERWARRALELNDQEPVSHMALGNVLLSLGAYDTAARLLLERIARNPGTDASRMLLASCYGHLGRAEDARITWAELLKVNPDFSLSQRARVLPYKDPGDFQRIAEGLAKAGLP
jgi:tetratricopeptide (TPR) repeat protein